MDYEAARELFVAAWTREIKRGAVRREAFFAEALRLACRIETAEQREEEGWRAARITRATGRQNKIHSATERAITANARGGPAIAANRKSRPPRSRL
jgi:hypothetical protein